MRETGDDGPLAGESQAVWGTTVQRVKERERVGRWYRKETEQGGRNLNKGAVERGYWSMSTMGTEWVEHVEVGRDQ